ncbi:hypothetical protein NIES2100_34910 [Calothrix sp. NIES-2100]|uniref:cellulase family glycosylhydrolase n=1 Tax=Calothrix sp. NIES-2100 TaxID=1954172 RepID=UPI000B6103F8|nr:hypothetical protein NIES2100_34910 [Calothrix sp. NIES-2100]
MSTFNIVGKRIFAPDGSEFIPRGFNFLAYRYGKTNQRAGTVTINGQTRVIGPYVEDSIVYAKAWGINTIRVCCNPLNTTFTGDTRPESIANAVEAITSEGIVCILEYCHAVNGQNAGYMLTETSNPTLQQVADIGAYYANLYKNNPLVWLEPLNEPGGMSPASQLDAWARMYQVLIKSIRDTGFNNIIVCNGLFFGQEGVNYNANPVSTGSSAILSRGRNLLSFRDPNNPFAPVVNYNNILFGIHVYETWGWDADTSSTQDQYTEKLRNYITRVHDLDLCIFLGEFGSDNAGNSTERATQATYAVTKEKRIGALYWEWHGDSGAGRGLTQTYVIDNKNIQGGYCITPVDGTKPTNLRPSNGGRHNGEDFWNWLRYWDANLYKSSLTVGGSNYFGNLHTIVGFSKPLTSNTIYKLSQAIANLYVPSINAPFPINEFVILREDGSYILREDDSTLLREASELIYQSLLREDGDFILREDGGYLFRENADFLIDEIVLREDGSFVLRENGDYVVRERYS